MSTQTDHRAGSTKLVTTGGALLLALAVAFGVWSVGRSGGDDPVAAGDAGEAPPAEQPADQPVEPGDDVVLSFAFTGEEGPEGCSYDGPTSLVAGKYATTFDPGSAKRVAVNLDPIKADVTYEDFLGQIGATEGQLPVSIASEDMNPEAQAWLDGSFRTIHQASTEVEAVQLLAGRFVIYCWTPDDGGARVWPAGSITVHPAAS